MESDARKVSNYMGIHPCYLFPDINVDSEVSFHDKASGYLKYRNDELAANPMNNSMVFSVRTDQKRALFVYAHDQFDNFVQVGVLGLFWSALF
jgi:hypothetical protein